MEEANCIEFVLNQCNQYCRIMGLLTKEEQKKAFSENKEKWVRMFLSINN